MILSCGSISGPKRPTTAPSRPTRNFSKFHATSVSPAGRRAANLAVGLEQGFRPGLRQRPVERIRIAALDRDLGEDREVHTIGQPAEILDLGIRARLLPGEIVGREAEHDQAAIAIVAVERLEPVILRRQPAFGRDIDDQKHLASIVAKAGRRAIGALDGDVRGWSWSFRAPFRRDGHMCPGR